jgi:cytochrome o ubiquinol oxidase subunit 1
LPKVAGLDAFWSRKQDGAVETTAKMQAFAIPKNTPIGVIIAFFAVAMGFALIWHIWWLAIVGLAGIVVTSLVHFWQVAVETEVSVASLDAYARGHPATGAPT